MHPQDMESPTNFAMALMLSLFLLCLIFIGMCCCAECVNRVTSFRPNWTLTPEGWILFFVLWYYCGLGPTLLVGVILVFLYFVSLPSEKEMRMFTVTKRLPDFLKLLRNPTENDTEMLTCILHVDLARNDALLAEFADGVTDATERQQRTFLRKFYQIYRPPVGMAFAQD